MTDMEAALHQVVKEMSEDHDTDQLQSLIVEVRRRKIQELLKMDPDELREKEVNQFFVGEPTAEEILVAIPSPSIPTPEWLDTTIARNAATLLQTRTKTELQETALEYLDEEEQGGEFLTLTHLWALTEALSKNT